MKKAQTWIITCFCLQLLLLNPLVKAQSSCGNPVTDDVNDIAKLVGNLPNDYLITLKYVPKMDSLDFIKENGHLYEEDRFIPENFFRLFNSTIEVYKEFADSLDKNDCIMPSTVETPENDSRVAVTKTISFPPVAASSLRNDSIGSNTSSNSNKEALGFISSSSLQGISIALTSLLSLLIGFILGAIYWKKTHPKSRPESNETIQCHGCQEENEISMLQQKEKEHLQV
ncbi:kit ligand isoform 2 precursor [Gallus gallus]|uniref:Kit ligand n=1 Tax=Gallus gallus TaxID=9031 RepID=Q009U4_CHICK|nr:kit ligand isoform 2 precursor [Gallus gallus]ABI98397.1 KIT ligand precursor form 3 [Gallus gallus]|eukprot:NP_001098785.1 kit ligand isoform 2 precursor [Gallus gallus]